MKTSRRNFIAGISGIAAATIPTAAAFASSAIVETQEEKCIRLSKELLVEFSKLPFHGESRGGPYLDLRNDDDIDSLRYVEGNDGRSTLIMMIDMEGAQS